MITYLLYFHSSLINLFLFNIWLQSRHLESSSNENCSVERRWCSRTWWIVLWYRYIFSKLLIEFRVIIIYLWIQEFQRTILWKYSDNDELAWRLDGSSNGRDGNARLSHNRILAVVAINDPNASCLERANISHSIYEIINKYTSSNDQIDNKNKKTLSK